MSKRKKEKKAKKARAKQHSAEFEAGCTRLAEAMVYVAFHRRCPARVRNWLIEAGTEIDNFLGDRELDQEDMRRIRSGLAKLGKYQVLSSHAA